MVELDWRLQPRERERRLHGRDAQQAVRGRGPRPGPQLGASLLAREPRLLPFPLGFGLALGAGSLAGNPRLLPLPLDLGLEGDADRLAEEPRRLALPLDLGLDLRGVDTGGEKNIFATTGTISRKMTRNLVIQENSVMVAPSLGSLLSSWYAVMRDSGSSFCG